MRLPRAPRTGARGPESAWDTRSPGGAWPGDRDRLALFVGAALLVVAILTAVTGKVLASGPPILPDNSPTADHSEVPTPASSPEPVDPRSLFLDLPDPEVSGASAIRKPETSSPRQSAAAQDVPSPARRADATKEAAGPRGRGEGFSGRAARHRSAGLAPTVPEIPKAERARPAVRSVAPGSGKASDLLADPDCRFSSVARRDLEAGIVDEHLISALQAVCRKHSIYVNVFKTGHTFGAGLEEGPTIPVGYGNAGGYPNTHYFGRAADIWEVDGKPIEGNGADPDVVSVGRIMAGLPTRNKPDVVIGPAAWNRALGYGPEQGWVLATDQVSLHDDHLHIGYWHGDGTPPSQLFLSTGDNREAGPQPPAPRGHTHRSENSAQRSHRTPPKLKETIQPAEVPSEPRPKRAARKEVREKPVPQKTRETRVQRTNSEPPETEKSDPPRPRTRPAPEEQRPEPEVQRPVPEKQQPEAKQRPARERTAPAAPEETSSEDTQTPFSGGTTVSVETEPEESPSDGETVADAVRPG